MEKGSFKIKVGLAEMLKGGVIMDVTNVEQACIAEKAGAVAVMALEKIPADIRRDGGISRMSNPAISQAIAIAWYNLGEENERKYPPGFILL